MKQPEFRKGDPRTVCTGVMVVRGGIVLGAAAVLVAACVWIVGSVHAQNADQPAMRQEAIEIAFDVLVHASLDHTTKAYLTIDMLAPGDVIAPWYNRGHEYVITEPTWFCWIDDYPEARFAHATRYVFINAITREIEVFVEPWWPTLNGKSLFMSDMERADANIVIYSDVLMTTTVGGAGQ